MLRTNDIIQFWIVIHILFNIHIDILIYASIHISICSSIYVQLDFKHQEAAESIAEEEKKVCVLLFSENIGTKTVEHWGHMRASPPLATESAFYDKNTCFKTRRL